MTQDWLNGQFIYRTNSKKYYECPYECKETSNPFEHKLKYGLGVPTYLPVQSIFTIRSYSNDRVLTYTVHENSLYLNDKHLFTATVRGVTNIIDLEQPIKSLIYTIATPQRRCELPQRKKIIRMLYDIIEVIFNPTLEYSLYDEVEFMDEYKYYKENIAIIATKLLEI